jgi:hypothetical protein
MNDKRIIDLSWFGNVGLVINRSSGVFYANLAAGYACKNPEMEGVFYPLRVKPGKSELFSLQQHFRGSWEHIEKPDADFVDKVLRRNGHEYVRVDRAKLADSYEAWVHVSILSDTSDLSGFAPCNGVLIWPNSD